ncbi:tetratricopeptide repeat protein [Aeromonas veronii]|uniref:tetratricopeptide repeat protein n=1 Tax=Aeromonas veronii TaxID=654 RepID=UPI0002808311|nr:tetratricopeptide repeat protein [Aeromonas veronii]EKB14507.1 hypothetical protein HMPREF1169_01785 [Aeromonas veronii AER397]
MDKSELPEEITTLIKAAEDGDATAQYELGYKYRRGQGVEQSDIKALYWYQKSAEQDNPFGQNALGGMYHNGWGVEQDNKKAFYWFTKSAQQGLDIGQFHLGNLYLYNATTKTNDSKAVFWFRKAAKQGNSDAQCNLGWMYDQGRGVKQSYVKAVELYRKAADNGSSVAQFNLGLCYMTGTVVEQDDAKALSLLRKAANGTDSEIRFESIEMQDQIERKILSPQITTIRQKILNLLKVDSELTKTMTHYTSIKVGNALLFGQSPLRLGHINALNDPNEGKLLWRYLGHASVEGKPVFVGCFLPEEDSLNMWRFYSKNQNNDDACGCAITFNTETFFSFNLLNHSLILKQQTEPKLAFSNTGKSPQESATFYRIVYINDDMTICGDNNKDALEGLFNELKKEANIFLGNSPDDERLQQLSRLLGPLPFLLKDADYEAEKEHRIIVTHLEYGANEIQVFEPTIEDGIPITSPRLYLELHRTNHLDPIKHVTLGPKSPHQEMMAPYWHHKLASEFPNQLKAKPDFYVRTSRCAYK